ncbi:vacuolar protein sorting/targeting protein PEP1, partial [Coemansia asiatica]
MLFRGLLIRLCVAQLLLAATGLCVAKGKSPLLRHTYFKESVSKLVYFKNRSTILGLDKAGGLLYRSTDFGESWTKISDIAAGQVSRLYAHPHEPKIAYALTEDTQHWVTRDEGGSWKPFSSPLPPTTSGERPLAFHAERTGWILFTGEKCVEEKSGWWPFPRLICHDEAFYVKDGFAQAVKDYKSGDRTGSGITSLLGDDHPIIKCLWARQTKEFDAMAEEAIFCLEIVTRGPGGNSNSENAKRQLNNESQTLSLNYSTSLHPSQSQPTKLHMRMLAGPEHQSAYNFDADDGDGLSVPLAEAKQQISAALTKRDLADEIAGLLDSQFARRTVQLIVSENFFSTKKTVHFGSGNDGAGGDQAGGGVLAISVLKNFVMAAISHAHSEEMDLFITMDGHVWAESHLPLPPGTQEDAYTILESSAHAVFVDVVTSPNSVAGTLFRSNSNGTYYTQSLEHTHRSHNGLVDVERVHGVEGVVVANQVANWDKLGHGLDSIIHREKLELKTRISFNDGARWRFVKPPERDIDGKKYGCSRDAWQTGECALHLHSVTSARSPGHVFGSASSPGVILAVGSVGPKLLPWRSCDTFLSRDGGISWKMVRRGSHHVQLADSGSVMVLADDKEPTDTVFYSLDSGESWQGAALDAKTRIRALFIDDNGLSPVLLAIGTALDGSHANEQVFVSIDFTKSWSRQCAIDPSDPKAGRDTESFVLVAHEDNDCILGHRSEHIRRKPSADCFMRLNQVLVPRQTDCDCTAHDFECDFNYSLGDKGRCKLVGSEIVPHGQCQHPSDRFMASSGYRLIPGNTCIRNSANEMDKPVEKPCPRVQNPGSGEHGHNDEDGGQVVLGPVSHHTLVVSGDPHIMTFPNTTAFLLMTSEQALYRSDDEGARWVPIDLAKSTGNSKIGKPVYLAEHAYHNSRAYVYTENDVLAFTSDRGATWSIIGNLPSPANGLHIRPIIDYNPANPDWLLFVGGTACPNCHSEIWVTADHGKMWSRITTHATKCLFARSKEFSELPEEAVICTNYRLTSGRENEQDLQDKQGSKRNPDNFVEIRVFPKPFTYSSFHAISLPSPEKSEILSFYIHGRFIVAAVLETVLDETGSEEAALKLFISDDGKTIHEARFPPGVNIKPEGFTLLPSYSGTILIDIEGAPNTGDPDWGTGWGTLFASNSNGTHFHMVLQHTNRNHMGLVDVERVDGLRGMLIANQVANAEALGRPGVRKELRTVASWDNGRSWHPLEPPLKDSSGNEIDCIDCSLHLYSRSSMIKPGPQYGAKTAPGYLVGIGSVGTHLDRYTAARTYMSRDGGISWAEIRATQTQYEFGDHGALLMLIDDTGPTDTLHYSVNGGISWKSHRFTDNGVRVIVDRVTNGMDSGGQGLLIQAREIPASGGGTSTDESMLVYVDFSKMFTRQCQVETRDHSKSDFELWTPRWGMDSGGRSDAICVLGSEISYWRRKPTASCFVGNEFEPPMTSMRTCECTIQDFECDEGFWLNDYGQCTLDGPDPYQPSDCRDGTTYKGRSGYTKIAQSQCTGGKDLSQPVERICGRAGGMRATAMVLQSPVADIQYFKNSHHVVVRTEDNRIWASLDEGAQWAEIEMPHVPGAARPVDGIAAIVRQPYFEDYTYFIPKKGSLAFYTDDEARTVRALHLPTSPAHLYQPVLRFHPDYPDWLIFLGQPNESCESVDASSCQVEAFVSRDHGAHWDALTAPLGPGGCSFLKTDRLVKVKQNAIVCGRHVNARDGGGDIVVSNNWFARNERVLVKRATDFAIMGGFLVISQDVDDGQALRMHISLDGETVAVANFPGNKLTVDSAYTVLDPPEGFEYRDERGYKRKMPGAGMMMHVTKSNHAGAEWGTIFTSNSNGTYYRQTLEFVNRDENGLVDFERIRALEGVSIANIVANHEDVLKTNKPKRLQSMITIDGGSRWHYLSVDGATHCHMTAPKSGNCALHLHGYTEVSDPENIYSASGAVGLLMGVGTVGDSLGRIGQSDTYLSSDGGATWRLVRKGPMWHEFGDHGGIIVTADRLHPVSEIEYSLDQAKTWQKMKLPDKALGMRVEFLTTTPDSTSRHFLLYGKKDGSHQGTIVGLDFTGAQPRLCKFDPLDEKKHENLDDFELFMPKPIDPSDDKDSCVLGRKVQYYRRTADRQCYVGDEFRPARFISETCQCTMQDYECNHNFVREFSPDDPDALGRCVLIKGMQAPRTNCTEGQKDYFVIESAYRKIPQSICQNGLILDRPKEVWCPGKARSVAIFWSLFLPVFFLSLAYVAYHTWRSRYPYLRLEDIGAAGATAIRNWRPPTNPNAGVLQQLQPVFFGAVSTAKAVGNAAKEGFLWSLDRAAPYLPSSIQRWSYEHPPRWGAQLSMDGRSRRAIRRGEGGNRFNYRPLGTNEAASRIFGDFDDSVGLDIDTQNGSAVDEYDEFEAGFNHFLEEENVDSRNNLGIAAGEADARIVDRQVLFANTELSDEEDDDSADVNNRRRSSESTGS